MLSKSKVSFSNSFRQEIVTPVGRRPPASEGDASLVLCGWTQWPDTSGHCVPASAPVPHFNPYSTVDITATIYNGQPSTLYNGQPLQPLGQPSTVSLHQSTAYAPGLPSPLVRMNPADVSPRVSPPLICASPLQTSHIRRPTAFPSRRLTSDKFAGLIFRFWVQETRVGIPTKCIVLTRTHVSNFKYVSQNMEHIIPLTFNISHVACYCFQMLICQNISNCTPYEGALESSEAKQCRLFRVET